MQDSPVTPAALLESLLKQQGLNPNSLGRKLKEAGYGSGLQAAMSRFLHGRSVRPSTLVPVADYFGVDVSAFASDCAAQEWAVRLGILGHASPSMDLAGRIEEMMDATRMSVADVARIAQVSSAVVSLWRGKSGKPVQTLSDLLAATRLEEHSGFSALWLAAGIGPKFQSQHHSGHTDDGQLPTPSGQCGHENRITGSSRRKAQCTVPVVGEVSGGDGLDLVIRELRLGFIAAQSRDANAYALRVRGDSMYPRYRSGEFVLIDPNVEAQIGDDVVVLCTNGKKLLKQLARHSDGEVQFISINAGMNPTTMLNGEVISMQLVAGHVGRGSLVR